MSRIFNIRVYGILLQGGRVLLSKEQYGRHTFVKFPGGGMEYGEGTIDCLRREFKEELGLDIRVSRHVYTTDFFQQSVLDDSQILSIYYLVEPESGQQIPSRSDTGSLYFRSVDADLSRELSLPIDRVVGTLLVDLISV